MWKVIKYGILILLLALALPRLTSWLPFTFPFAHPEQDECTFGPVTNAEYRAMLSKARSLQRWRWLGSKPEAVLLKQFLEVSENSSSPYVKISAMHAVFRAIGADFRNNGLSGDDIFARVSKKGGTISYSYALPVPRIGVLALPGNAWFIGSLKGPPHSIEGLSRVKYRQGQVYFISHFPNPVDQIPDVLWRGAVSCPPVPPEGLEAFFADAPNAMRSN
jgi:hypothetical protein